jgi:ABC-type antimicrobial peptide transport system permease subunit
MKYDKDDLAQRVAIALLYDVIEERKPQIQAMVKQHGLQPSDESDNLYYQVVQLSNDRGNFFDGDLVKQVNEAGYFGIDTILAGGLKISGAAIKKVTDAVKELKSHPKTDADGAKIKLKDRLKGIFKAKDGTLVTKEDVAKNPDAEKVADATNPDAAAAKKKAEEDAKKADKKILGMSVGLFVGLTVLLVIIVIAIILIINANKKKKLAAKKKEVGT